MCRVVGRKLEKLLCSCFSGGVCQPANLSSPEERRIMMKRTLALPLIFISVCCSFTLGSSDFHLISLLKTYDDAKSFCREMYTDLATIHNSTDMSNLSSLVSSATARAWIGLEMGDEAVWHWSWPNKETDFFNWKTGEPQTVNQSACAAMDNHGEWFESDCDIKRMFVCHGPGDTSSPVFVAKTKSWRDAQSYCRSLSSDLVSVHSAEENNAVQNVSASQVVWLGLFRDQWKWSDGSNSSFRFWKTSQPNYNNGQECTAAVFNDGGQWNNLKCGDRNHFICHGAEAAPALGLTAPNTTEITSFTSSPELDNVTTETPTQLTPVTSMNVTTSQNTTHSNTTEGQSVETANLILIQENMTWIEAMSYCREHHIDLVHISSKDVQEKVAEKAKNASSLHVWLGLRYTCQFKFWFWTTSSFGCYQNWVPGQGSEGKYGCGVSGAIEATGGQQWVGLPEMEKLNFICSACTV
ncbi:macrophage mannose receptor 1-like isoform X2 [Parambassis ranga]|uniref:Macrophage mannose receptor 1-like isoform X2 n=1 Tax=Parambassis ranga TaxID=210632 RepID=A0A6P7JYK8_9TELE|nr:macrophage mannose receptor 1-like isoform X2 [Parambassis ranga]